MKDSSADLLMARLLWRLRFEKQKWAGVEHVEHRQLQYRPGQAAQRNVQPHDRIPASTASFLNRKTLVDSPCSLKVMRVRIVTPATDPLH